MKHATATLEGQIRLGDKVRTGVFVNGEWRPGSPGFVVSQTADGSISGVDIMSLHGGAPWVLQERTDHLRKEPVASKLGDEVEL